ncbi:MAG: MFS transporter [Synergistes sp.]|nr:MFS transporter [Synergistes sp.]
MNDIKYDLTSTVFFRLFVPFALCYFMSPLLGSANAIMAPILIENLSLTPSDLGLMSSVYLVAFGAAQFPVGIMLDKYGAKVTLPVSLIFAVAGTLLYSQAYGYAAFALSRALSGMGLAGCLMCAYKSYDYWIRPDKLPIAYSAQALMGGLGGMFATKPLSAAFGAIGWRNSFVVLAAVLVVIALMIIFIVPKDKPSDCDDKKISSLFKEMLGILAMTRFWHIAIIVSVVESVYFVFQFLWIGPWMLDVAEFSESQAAFYMMFSFAGVAAGYFLCGPIAVFLENKRIMKWKTFYVLCGYIETVLLLIIAAVNSKAAAFLWTPAMIFAAMSIIAFSIIRGRFAEEETGRVLTLVNCFIFMASFVLQWIVGIVIGLFPSSGGHFSPDGYRCALIMYAVICITATVWGGRGMNKDKV